MNKLNTLYWIHSPKDNKIIILALLEEHPKSNRGYSKKELLKRLPKNIPDDLLNSENEDSEENYSQKLKISDLGKLIRVSTNRFKIGAIYRDEKRNYYLFFKIDNNSFIFLKLDDLTKDKEVLSSSSILDLLDYHKEELFQYNKNFDLITKIDFSLAKNLLNKSLYISYNSDESIKELLIMINEFILLIKVYDKGFDDGKNLILSKQ